MLQTKLSGDCKEIYDTKAQAKINLNNTEKQNITQAQYTHTM